MIEIIPTCVLWRLEESEDYGTFGVLLISDQVFCATLEPPDRLNKTGKSSIPAQQYVCRKHMSPTFGNTYKVWNVPGRSEILFHAGNTIHDTAGCIILGQYWGKISVNRAVLNSGKTFRYFLDIMKDHDEFNLTIRQAWG